MCFCSFGNFAFLAVKRRFSMATHFINAFIAYFTKWVRLVILRFWAGNGDFSAGETHLPHHFIACCRPLAPRHGQAELGRATLFDIRYPLSCQSSSLPNFSTSASETCPSTLPSSSGLSVRLARSLNNRIISLIPPHVNHTEEIIPMIGVITR